MKKIYTYLMAFAAMLCISVAAFADNDPNPKALNLKKSVSKVDRFHYTLTLEAYVTGASITTTSDINFDIPCDIVLLLDESSSMNSNKVTTPGETVTGPLTVGTSYRITINGTEYYLKGFKPDTYQALGSTEYSYNSVSGGDYYFLYEGNWYPVSGYRRSSSSYYLTVNVNGTTNYIKSDGSLTTSRNSGATSNSQSGTIWTGVLYSAQPGNTYYYRYGTTEPSSYTSGTEFFTGTTNYTATAADKISTQGGEVTREVAMKAAACEFVQTIYKNNPATGDKHNIAVGYFNSALTWLVNTSNPLIELASSSNVTAFQNAINAMSYSTYTNTDKAMEGAYNVLNDNAVKTDGHNKIVVLFTDGEPANASGTFYDSIARSAVEYSYSIKNNLTNTLDDEGGYTTVNPKYSFPAKVYSVAILSSETAKTNKGAGKQAQYDIRRFLHYISSNYKFGESLASTYYFDRDHADAVCQIEGAPSTYKGSEAPHDYYQLSTGSDLTSIFTSIAESASQTTGSANYQLDETSTTVLDVITEDFALPEGVVAGDIKVYTAQAVVNQSEPAEDADGRKWYTFGTPVEFTDAEIDPDPDNNRVTVGNFGFSDGDSETNGKPNCDGNWVGPRTGGNLPDGVYGKELIIEIPIVLDPDFNGGYNDLTNTAESGVYFNGEEVGYFPIPYYDFPSIAIRKWGLKKGESALFSVQRLTDLDNSAVDDEPYIVSVTGSDDDGSMVYAIVKDIPEGKYRVSEMDWSWTYDIAQPASGVYIENVLCRNNALNDSAKGGEVDGVYVVLFDFENQEKTLTAKHAESVVINDFETGTSTNY